MNHQTPHFVSINMLVMLCGLLHAQQPDSLLPNATGSVTSRVSPVLEMEILDPNQDARGNPAIQLTTDEDGQTQVEIPPSIIVHRYYYTGDRSFRGPDLPGGPSIVVAQNPRDGQQCYLPVQMLPGSPVVHYTERKIEYDFGNRAVIISFPAVGDPVVSYRNGRPLSEKVVRAMGVDKAKQLLSGTKTSLNSVKEKAGTAAKATSLAAQGAIRPLSLPMQNLARFLPGNAALTDPNLKNRIDEQAAINARQREIARAQSISRQGLP